MDKSTQKQEILTPRKWEEDCWAIIFSLFREYNLQRLRSKQEESTEEEEMKQQQRMASHERSDKENQIKSGRMDAKNRWWVAELLAKDCEKAWTHTGWRRYHAEMVRIGWNT